MANAKTPYSRGEDPFFWLPGNSEWNACIGQQASEENYVDGYMEAAIELASAVIEKRMYGRRDTLAMPILYNARHALELLLKFAINKLYEMDVIENTHPKNHDIMSHWTLLHASALGDEALRECVTALTPFITSLSQIDDDGQELRYSENRDGQKSLADRSLANIAVIQLSLGELNEVMMRLKNRVLDLIGERATGSFTAACSRRDLLEIAQMLPKRSDWCTGNFDEVKTNVMERFNLSGRDFSKAVDVIEGNRAMRRLIGLETSLVHLSDENTLFAVEQWARRHPIRPVDDIFDADCFTERNLDMISEHLRLAGEVNYKILETLTPEEITDLEVIYYIGRDGTYCEYYEKFFELTRRQHCATADLELEVNHLMEKTNFQQAIVEGIFGLGRPDLADKLLQIKPDVAPL